MTSIELALGIVSRMGQFLLIRRADPDPPALVWAFPGGKVEPGEQPQTAVVREVLEETGLRVVVRRQLYSRIIPENGVQAHYFVCDLAVGETGVAVPDGVEVAACRWVSGPEALRLFQTSVAAPVRAFLLA